MTEDLDYDDLDMLLVTYSLPNKIRILSYLEQQLSNFFNVLHKEWETIICKPTSFINDFHWDLSQSSVTTITLYGNERDKYDGECIECHMIHIPLDTVCDLDLRTKFFRDLSLDIKRQQDLKAQIKLKELRQRKEAAFEFLKKN